MQQVSEQYRDRDFWACENLRYSEPHFRLEKAAGLITKIVRGKECDLLDVGCGPAALMPLLPESVHYYGIDMAIHNPAPFLIESDFVANAIRFGDKTFDIVLAQGVFEYIGTCQAEKFAEIRRLLKPKGTFILSYVNFDHLNKFIYEPYNNVLSHAEFLDSLKAQFRVDRIVPTSHHWRHNEPTSPRRKKLQMHMNLKLPVLSRMFAIEYFFICSHLRGVR